MNSHTQEEGHGSRHTGPGIEDSSYNTANGMYKKVNKFRVLPCGITYRLAHLTCCEQILECTANIQSTYNT